MSRYRELANYFEDRDLFNKLSEIKRRLQDQIMPEYYDKIREVERNVYREDQYSPEDTRELLITLENIKENIEDIKNSGKNPRRLLNIFMLLQYNMDLLK